MFVYLHFFFAAAAARPSTSNITGSPRPRHGDWGARALLQSERALRQFRRPAVPTQVEVAAWSDPDQPHEGVVDVQVAGLVAEPQEQRPAGGGGARLAESAGKQQEADGS